MHGAQDEGPSGQDGKTHPGPDGTEHEDGGDGGAVQASTKKKGKTPDGKDDSYDPPNQHDPAKNGWPFCRRLR